MKKNTVKVILSTLVAILIIAILTGMGGIQQLHKVKVQNQGIQENIVQQETSTKPSVEELVTPSPEEKEKVEPSEELNIAEPTTQPIDGINSDLSTSSPEIDESKGDNYTSEDDPIYSSVYLVTLDTVERVNPETTVDEFIANLEVSEGNSIKIYKGEEEVTQGYIGTGMKVVSNNKREYKISVRGDITGEGIANQVELTMIIRHIVGQEGWNLEGINYSSGDITGDGKVDLVDVSKMINYIVYGTWEYEEVETPNAPTIVVITQKGEDGYYINKAEVKIVEDKSTENSKTTYKITGTKEVAETQISEGEAIEIEGEGTYLITAYTYGIKGNRSKGSNQIIKIREEKTAEYKETIYKMDVEGVYKKETTIKSGKVGEEVEITTTAPEGFTYDEEESTPKGTIQEDGSTELTVYFERNKYELHLSAGKGIDNVTGGGEYYYEKEIEIGAIEKAGYTFTEWTGDRTIEEKTTTIQIPVDGMSLTANATVNEYHIEYELNGGTLPDGQDEDDKYTVEKEHKLPTPEKPGYEFQGWTGDNGEDPEKEVTIPEGTTGDKYYEANWRKMGYSIVVHHIEKGTNVQVAKDEEFIGKNGETYTITDLITNNGANERETINSDKYYYIEASGNTTGTYSEEIDGTEVTLYYGVHTFRISNSETEGGTISDIEETVRYGEDSTKEIVITPNKGNKVDTITVNETVIEFEEDVDTKIVKLPVFRNVTEDKVIKVTFVKIPVVAEITTCQIERLKGTQYETLREAIEAIENENLTAQDSQTTITMLANTQEGANVIIDKNIQIDLKGYTIKSSTENPTLTIQSGTLNIVDSSEEIGTIKNTKGTAVKVEQGATLTIGEDDEEVSQTSPKIEGINYGVDVQGTFNYYDGIIIGVIAINGDVADMPYLKNPSVTNEDGKQVAILATVSDVEATIKKKTFITLEKAIEYANTEIETDGGQVEIVVVRDLTKVEEVNIDETKNIKLNLNEHTITLKASIVNSGKLEIINVSQENIGGISSNTVTPLINTGILKIGNVKITATNNETITNKEDGTVEIAGGIITSNTNSAIHSNSTGNVTVMDGTVAGYDYGIYNENTGNITISGGNISQTQEYSYNKKYSAIYNGTTGNLEITGGTILGQSTGIYNNSTGNIKITGGKIKTTGTYAIYNNGGELTLIDGDILVTDENSTLSALNSRYAIQNNGGAITITGGTITVEGTKKYEGYGIYNIEAGTVTITGGEITSIGYGIDNGYNGTLRIENGKITGNNRGIYTSGTLKMTGGSINATNDTGIGIYSAGATIIENGTITGVAAGITNSGTLTIGKKDSNVNEESPIIKGKYGIKNEKILNFYDGKVTGDKNQAITGIISAKEENYYLQLIINEDTTETMLLGEKTNVVQIDEIQYETLQEAINVANEGDTLTLIANIMAEEEITIPEEKNIIIDFNGYKLLQYNVINNNGDVLIKDSNQTQIGSIVQNVNDSITNNQGATLIIQNIEIVSKAVGSSQNILNVIVNNGEIELAGCKISVESNYSCGVYSTGKIKMTSGSITVLGDRGKIYGINSTGEVIIEGGTITVTGENYKESNYGIKSTGKVTITGGTIAVTSSNSRSGAAYGVYCTGALELNGGVINATINDASGSAPESAYSYGIYANGEGNITIKKGTITATANSSSYTTSDGIIQLGSGLINIEGGTINSIATNNYMNNSTYAYGVRGKILMQDGKISATAKNIYKTKTNTKTYAYGIYNYGESTISGGTITVNATGAKNNYGYGINNNVGTLTVSGVIVNSDKYGIFNGEEGTVIITSGTINAKGTNDYIYGIYNSGNIEMSSGTIDVNGGYYAYGIYNNGDKKIKISGGTIKATGYSYIFGINNYNYGTVEITGGTITGQTNAIDTRTTGTVTIGVKDGNVNTTEPVITGKSYGVYIPNGTFNFYDGIITGAENKSIYGEITDQEDKYDVIKERNTNKTESATLQQVPIAKLVSTQKEYYTINEAIADAKENEEETIQILRGTDIKSTADLIVIDRNKNIVLDLNGNTLTKKGNEFLENNGTLKIQSTNSLNVGTLKLSATTSEEDYAKLIVNNGQMSLASGSIIGIYDYGYGIYSTGQIEMTGGTINVSGKTVYGICNEEQTVLKEGTITVSASNSQGNSSNPTKANAYGIEGSVIVEGGTIKTTASNAYNRNEYGVLAKKDSIIKGGTVTGSVHNSDASTLKIEKGDITGSVCNDSEGIIDISGGTITVLNGPAIRNDYSGTIKINGGTVNATGSYAYAILENSGSTGTIEIIEGKINATGSSGTGIENRGKGSIKISGGTITAGKYAISGGGKLEITDGTISATGNNGVGITTGDETIILGGTISGTKYGISTNYSNKLTIGNKDKDINVNTPIIIGKEYGIFNSPGYSLSTGGIFNFYDGIITGAMNKSIYGEVTEVEEGYNIIIEINENNTETAKLQQVPIAKLTSNNQEYYTINDAVNATSQNDESTIQILENVYITKSVVINKNINLDLNGKELITGKRNFIENNGTLKIMDSSPEKTGIVKLNTKGIYNNEIQTILNNGNLEVIGVTIIGGVMDASDGQYSYGIYNTGTTLIQTGTTVIGDVGGIYNAENGTVRIEGGTISGKNTAITNNSTGEVIVVNGTVTGNNAAITSTNTGTVTIENGIISGNSGGIDNNGTGEIRIEGGTITGNRGNGISNNSTGNVIITNGTINGMYYYQGYGVYNNLGTVTIKGGTITADGSAASGIYNRTGTVNIENVTINSIQYHGICNEGEGTIKITGGSITGNQTGIYNNTTGKIITEDGTVTGTTMGINNNSTGTVIAKGGKVTATNGIGINNLNEGTIELGIKNKKASTTIPEITGTTYGINNPSGTIKFYDGVVKGETSAIYGDVQEYEEGYELNITEEGRKATLKIAGAEVEAVAKVGSIYYNTIQDAVNAISDTGTITIYKDIKEKQPIVIPAGKNITMDLQACIISFSSEDAVIKIEENATLTLIDTFEEGTDEYIYAKIENTTGVAINNLGTLTIGVNDQIVYRNSPRIIGETYAIDGTGTTYIYDGQITGQTTGTIQDNRQ